MLMTARLTQFTSHVLQASPALNHVPSLGKPEHIPIDTLSRSSTQGLLCRPLFNTFVNDEALRAQSNKCLFL